MNHFLNDSAAPNLVEHGSPTGKTFQYVRSGRDFSTWENDIRGDATGWFITGVRTRITAIVILSDLQRKALRPVRLRRSIVPTGTG